MDPEDLHQLRKSFARLEAHGHLGALIFYQRLFALAPAVRPLFSTDIEVQSRKLTRMIAELLSLAEKPNVLKETVSRLGERHVAYGARAEHYPVVIQAFLEMMAEVLGADFTPALREKWRSLLESVSVMMLAASENSSATRSPSRCASQAPQKAEALR